ncbi:MAG: hypothetical protein VCA55_04780 [Verrucomicrobiales bacterium]
MLVIFGGAGCETLRNSENRRDAAVRGVISELKTKVVGSICMTREELGFVLIKASSKRLPEGCKLEIKRYGSSTVVAELLVSPEKKKGFIVADILSGHPQKGDLAFLAIPPSGRNDSGGEKIPVFNGIPTEIK